MTGRPPTPIGLRVLMGNPAKRPIPAVPQARLGRPRAPSWLTPDAKAEFGRLCRELGLLGILSPADASIITLASATYGTWCRAVRLLNGLDDAALADAAGRRLRAIASDAAGLLLRCWAECGLTPCARSRLHLPPQKPADELTNFLHPQGGVDGA